MLSINFQAEVDKFTKQIDNFAFKQVPFATAQALNAIADLAKAAEIANEKKVLDRPRPFTTGAIRVRRATKSSQEAILWMMDTAAGYLEPYQFGGTNLLNSKALLMPIAAMGNLDQYGNLPRNFIATLKSRSDVFFGTVQTKNGPVDGIWQRATEEGAAKPTRTIVNKKTGQVKVRKTAGFVPLHKGRKLKLLVRFEDAHQVKQNLDWFGVAGSTAAAAFQREFGRALSRAIATARK